MDLSRDVLMDLHRRMVRIRLFEEAAGRLAEGARLPGFLHLYVGEEAVAAGVCAALTDTDQITSTHRGHGHLVAKGGDFNRMMAELMGKATGYNKGKGGSMHICDLDLGMLGANGIVGAGSPIAVGAAFANKYRGDGNVAVAFFGDGATNIGAFHEAANMACALQLPIVFACENNEYGEFTPRDKTMAITDIVDRAAGYGMPGVVVDGMDVVAVHEAAVEAVARARAGEGPRAHRSQDLPLLQPPRRAEPGPQVPHRRRSRRVEATRPHLHVRRAPDRERAGVGRRDRVGLGATASRHRDGDPVRRGQSTAHHRPDHGRRLHREVRDGRVMSSTSSTSSANGGDEPRTLAYVMAFNEAVRQAMEADDDVFVAGEDVGAFGGVFGTFGGPAEAVR
jgi:hypothetical protein